MDEYTISEQAYKNGYEKGFHSGEYESIRKMYMYLESRMADMTRCSCGRQTMKRFFKYCPYCGEKYGL